jgi:nucleoid-associated protein YgaU
MTTSFGSSVSSNAGGAAGGVAAVGSSPGLGTAVAAVGAVAGAAVGIASAVGALIPATLSNFDTDTPSAMGFIPFDFNPKAITITRTATAPTYKPASGAGAGTPAGSGGAIVSVVKPPEISISDITFEGLTTKWRCDQLFRWMSPPEGPDALAATMTAFGRPVASQPPTITFQWGPPYVGFWYDVKILSTNVVYERFNPIGIPVRAKVTLKMIQQVSKFGSLPTNPTSGGLPGRRTHVMKESESLHSVAMTYYGDPGAWRRIADINGITDPLRVRPGATVYLPGGAELAQGGGR